jgi:hypothetical protein
VTSMPNDRDPAPDVRPPGAALPPDGDEPEPDWAEEIRARRRARSDRLREVFATFDDEPGQPASEPQDPQPQEPQP